MHILDCKSTSKKTILALGAESAGNFSIFTNGVVFCSSDFGNLLEEANFTIYKKNVLAFLREKAIKPDIIITDLHPDMRTTLLGKQLCKKYKATYIQIQHHHAHLFSAIGEQKTQTTKYKIQTTFGIAMDGTGYGEDGRIWGGEVFEILNTTPQISKKFEIHRIGHLENQVMIGGELAIQEPARMLIAILNKFSIFNFQFSINSQFPNFKNKKDFIYHFIKKHYTKKEFEVLYNQLEQNFNCIETSSTGRILDAVSLLLGFCDNKRNYKHEAIDLLEKNSTVPYKNLKPKITQDTTGKYVLNTTYLFNYVIKYLHKDKKRLAATAQSYLAQGLYEIIRKNIQNTKYDIQNTFVAGGLTNTKIISQYFASKNIRLNKNIPRGDAGLSFGQIIYYLFNE